MVANSAIQITLRPGVPTLSQAAGLTYSAEVEADTTARTGQAIVVKFQEGNDIKDFLIHVGNPSSSANGVTSYRYPLSSLTNLGTQTGFQYLSSTVITIPAALPIYVLQIEEYAANQLLDAFNSVTGSTQQTISSITATAPLIVTNPTSDTRDIALPDGTITADKLKSSTETEKQTFRDKIGAVSVSDFEMQSTFSIVSFADSVAPYTYDLPINIPANMIKEAAGRPYELQISGTVEGRNKTEDNTFDIEIRSASGTGGTLWATKSITSTLGAVTNWNISAMLPPAETQFYVRFNRTAGVTLDGYNGEGYGKIKVGQLAKHVYVDSSSFDGNLGPGDDTVQELAQKVDDLVVGDSKPDDQVIAAAQHNGSGINPTPRIEYTINTPLVTANATDDYNMSATFTININNQQTLGSSVYRYRLQTASSSGILAEYISPAIAGGSARSFTLSAYVPVGTTSLFLKGSRRSGNGIALLNVSGRIYVEKVITADKVIANTSGFNNVLASGDLTAQLIFDKFNRDGGATWFPWTDYVSSYPNSPSPTTFTLDRGTYWIKIGRVRIVHLVINIYGRSSGETQYSVQVKTPETVAIGSNTLFHGIQITRPDIDSTTLSISSSGLWQVSQNRPNQDRGNSTAQFFIAFVPR